ncbi:MAG: hypothetical protein ACXW2A_07585 [Burkholderiales bacterium]
MCSGRRRCGEAPGAQSGTAATAAAKKEQEQAQLEREKKQLEQAQDRVIQHYKRTKGSAAAGASTAAGGKVEDRNMPKTTKELPGSAGPRGGTAQSAEAHSAPAK